MSALTRCKPRTRVRFRDASGKVRDGLVIYIRSDAALVGHQDVVRPWIQTLSWDGDKEVIRRTPNNSLWVVPFADIVETMASNVRSDAAPQAAE